MAAGSEIPTQPITSENKSQGMSTSMAMETGIGMETAPIGMETGIFPLVETFSFRGVC